jgi:excisionase family DNA binding protein
LFRCEKAAGDSHTGNSDADANLRAMSTTASTSTAPSTLLTVAEVADALRVSGETIRRRVADRTIHGVVLGRVIRIPHAEIERLLDDVAQLRPLATDEGAHG